MHYDLLGADSFPYIQPVVYGGDEAMARGIVRDSGTKQCNARVINSYPKLPQIVANKMHYGASKAKDLPVASGRFLRASYAAAKILRDYEGRD